MFPFPFIYPFSWFKSCIAVIRTSILISFYLFSIFQSTVFFPYTFFPVVIYKWNRFERNRYFSSIYIFFFFSWRASTIDPPIHFLASLTINIFLPQSLLFMSGDWPQERFSHRGLSCICFDSRRKFRLDIFPSSLFPFLSLHRLSSVGFFGSS